MHRFVKKSFYSRVRVTSSTNLVSFRLLKAKREKRSQFSINNHNYYRISRTEKGVLILFLTQPQPTTTSWISFINDATKTKKAMNQIHIPGFYNIMNTYTRIGYFFTVMLLPWRVLGSLRYSKVVRERTD